MNIDKISTFIRLAQKARKLEIGRTAVSVLLRRKRAAMVIMAIDASDKLKREFESASLKMKVPLFIFGDKAELGQLCGRESVAILGIADRNLAEGIKQAFSQS